MQPKAFLVFIILVISLVKPEILRLSQCNVYDAEFSRIKHNNRLVGNKIVLLVSITLRKCLTQCMYHSLCQSVNYMRLDEKCELLGDSAQLNATGLVNFELATGWNHLETNFHRKTVSFPNCRIPPAEA